MHIIHLTDPDARRRALRTVLESLPEWFGIPESREAYIREGAAQTCIACMADDALVGCLCLKPTSPHTLEIAMMGVLPAFHRQGAGRRMFQAALDFARAQDYAFLQVKTVQHGRYPCYNATNRFYRRMGFLELEVFPTLWDEGNPCQVYVRAV